MSRLGVRVSTAMAVAVVVAAVGATLLAQPSMLNLVVGVATLALLAVNIRLIPEERLAEFYTFSVWVFVVGSLLNVPYELWHSTYYAHFSQPGLTYNDQVWTLLMASVSDGFLAVVSLLAMTAAQGGQWLLPRQGGRRAAALVVLTSLGIQVAVELEALATGRWSYNDLMPLVPLLRVGLTPAAQMPALMIPILWLSHRLARRDPSVAGADSYVGASGPIPAGVIG